MLGNNRRSLFYFNNYYSFSMRESLFGRKKEEKYPKYREDTSIREEEQDPLSFLLKHCETLQVRVNIDNVIESKRSFTNLPEFEYLCERTVHLDRFKFEIFRKIIESTVRVVVEF